VIMVKKRIWVLRLFALGTELLKKLSFRDDCQKFGKLLPRIPKLLNNSHDLGVNMATKSFAKLLEGCGLLLILSALLWEFFISSAIDSESRKVESSRLQSKLNQLHYRQYMLKEHIDVKFAQQEHKLSTIGTGRDISKDWLADQDDVTIATFASQGTIARSIRFIIFLIGSTIMVVSKFLEAHVLRTEELQKIAAKACNLETTTSPQEHE
jgi:hypothetical protein